MRPDRALSERLTVLIADDEPPLRLLLRATIGREHFRVLEATNGSEALELARRERPSVVLLDVGMPRLNGYEVCRALKADPVTAGMMVIMVTARGQQTKRDEGIAAGADAYLRARAEIRLPCHRRGTYTLAPRQQDSV